MQVKYGLTCFQLKAIAAILMMLDHIYYFFNGIIAIPLWFTQIGRLSAPIFLFFMVEGFFQTQNRIKYFLRVYIVGAGMVLVRLMLTYPSTQTILINGMLSTFTILLVTLQGFEWIKEKKVFLGLSTVFVTLAFPYFIKPVFYSSGFYATPLYFLTEAFFPMHNLVPDGGTLIIISGLALYFFRKNKFLQAVAFVLAGCGYFFTVLFTNVKDVTISMLFYPYYQWMMGFAVIFFLLYNGKRGSESKLAKWFFYLFYPAHIYILYFAAFALQITLFL